MTDLTKQGFITATDLADYFVKQLKYPFRKAYILTAKIINFCEKNINIFQDLTLKEVQKIEPNINADVLKDFDLNISIKSKKSFGGTSFENIKKMIRKHKKEIK